MGVALCGGHDADGIGLCVAFACAFFFDVANIQNWLGCQHLQHFPLLHVVRIDFDRARGLAFVEGGECCF